MNPASRTPLEGLNLRALRAFTLVCQCGSATEAARTLGVTPAAISQFMASLEKEHGLALFDRRVRPPRPNAAGAALLKQAGPLLDHAEAVIRHVRAAAASQPALRVGSTETFCGTFAAGLLDALREGFHDIAFVCGASATLHDQLRARAIDIAIFTVEPENPQDRADLVIEPLFSEVFLLAAPRHFAAAGSAAPAVATLTGTLDLIRYSDQCELGAQIERYLRHVSIDSPWRYAFDTSRPILSLAAAGLGYAVTTPLCLWQSRQHFDELQIVALPPADCGRRSFSIACRAGTFEAELPRIRRQVLSQLHGEIRATLAGRLPNCPAVLFP
ncbi:MAG: LysR family transcriptional regulator [Comamonas sp.]